MATTIDQADILFPTFLEDHSTYHQVEAYWEQVMAELPAGADLTYTSFYNKHYRNGQKDYSGNPIFDAYFPDRHQLVRIIQYLPEPGDRLFFSYVDEWPVAEMEPDKRPVPTDPDLALQPIPELVISLVLTEETGVRAREVINGFLGF